MPKPNPSTPTPAKPAAPAAPPTATADDRPPLPPGWVWIRIGDLLTLEYGKGLRKDKRNPHGKVPVFGSNGIVGFHSEALVKPPCLIVGRKGTAGAIHLSETPCWPIDTTYYVVPPKGVLLRYLYYLFQTLSLHKLDKSTAIPGLNRNDVYKIRIPLAPQSEQRRIVAKIEELFSQLDAAEEGLRRVQRNLKRYRAAVLKAAVEGRLVPRGRGDPTDRPHETGAELLQRILAERRRKWEEQEWAKLVEKAKKKAAQARRKAQGRPARLKDIPSEEWQAIPEEEYRRYLPTVGATGGSPVWKQRYKEPTPPDTANLPPLPEGWAWATVEMVGEVVTGTTPPTSHKEYYGKDYPFYKPSDLEKGYYVKGAEEGLSKLGIQHARLLPAGSILVTSIGATIGKTGFIRQTGASNQQINAIVPYVPKTAEYIYFVCVSPLFQKQIHKFASATTLPIINKSKFSQLLIPLPPFTEQRRIVAEVERRLSVAREAEKAVEVNLKRIARLRQAILKRAFEGRLVYKTPSF